ncbi:MAG: hypothetical protein K2X80_16090 [Pseudomonadaceae bacterium]|nr:hypothetical protein [Pseudomonadaceae bacterium]
MKTKLWIFAGLLSPMLQVGAAEAFQPAELSDAEMANLRGRYVLPDRIIHFGVSMTSLWRNSAGDAIGAQVALQVNHQAQANLTVTPLYETGNGNPVNTGNGQINGGGGLASIQGIAQSVRTAGDFNNGRNDLNIEISHEDGAPAPIQGQSWTANQQFSNAAGKVTVSSTNGGLQLALQANHNQGSAQQRIGLGGVSQHANISGSLNNVENLATLSVALRNSTRGLDQLYCAWNQSRAMRPTGY